MPLICIISLDISTFLHFAVLFGCVDPGYRLVITTQPQCNQEGLTKFIKSHIPKAILRHKIGSEIWFNLPAEKTNFAALFRKMETRKRDIGIDNFTVSPTTLEDAFLR